MNSPRAGGLRGPARSLKVFVWLAARSVWKTSSSGSSSPSTSTSWDSTGLPAESTTTSVLKLADGAALAISARAIATVSLARAAATGFVTLTEATTSPPAVVPPLPLPPRGRSRTDGAGDRRRPSDRATPAWNASGLGTHHGQLFPPSRSCTGSKLGASSWPTAKATT